MRKLLSLFLCIALMGAMAVPALAAYNYQFATMNAEEFVVPQGIHTSELGVEIIAPELETIYGLPSGGGEVFYPDSVIAAQGVSHYQESSTGMGAWNSQYRESTTASVVKQKDGSLGTLKIPAIGLTAKVYSGDLTAAMKKGIGHMDSTSAWSGTVGLVGHNRGSWPYFGKLKDVKVGDAVTYQTVLGTRTYVVTFAGRIANNDWSYLQPAADNRLCLITCVADRPEVRLAVVATEKYW